MIPQNIKSEHILKAIEEVERSGIPKARSSDRYDIEYNKKIYPPKYIVSLANKYANGKELDHSEFCGGDEANNFLESLGFNIVNKQNDVDEDDLENLVDVTNLVKDLDFIALVHVDLMKVEDNLDMTNNMMTMIIYAKETYAYQKYMIILAMTTITIMITKHIAQKP